MIRTIVNSEHLRAALGDLLGRCRHRLLLATADLKALRVPAEVVSVGRRVRSSSLLDVLGELSARGVCVQLLHSGVPSGAFLEELREGLPINVQMRRCIRQHAKAVIADGRWMYLGSANLTGAGLGAKGPRRRNFEAGIVTDEVALIDPVLDMLEGVFEGDRCDTCDRRKHCPVPLEEPEGRTSPKNLQASRAGSDS